MITRRDDIPFINELDKRIDHALTTYSHYADLEDGASGLPVYVWRRLGPDGIEQVPPYSTNDAVAWAMLAEMRNRDFLVIVQARPQILIDMMGNDGSETYAVVLSHPQAQGGINQVGQQFATAASLAVLEAVTAMGLVEDE